MLRRIIGLILVLALAALPLYGCAGKPESTAEADAATLGDDVIAEDLVEIEETDPPLGAAVTPNPVTGKISTITDYVDAWTTLYSIHEPTVNNYAGMPILDLVMVGLPMVNAIFYSLLDLDNKDGKFDGPIGFSGHDGYYHKSGNQIKFGSDFERDANGFTPNELEGDAVKTEGEFDIDRGYLMITDEVARKGISISRTLTEFIRFDDGSYICLYQVIGDYDTYGDVKKSNRVTFISMGEDHYDYVIGVGEFGMDGKLLSLFDVDNAVDATELLKSNNYTIESFGGIENGVFEVNN